jgi:hypothetical protein
MVRVAVRRRGPGQTTAKIATGGNRPVAALIGVAHATRLVQATDPLADSEARHSVAAADRKASPDAVPFAADRGG